ncbi:hypothetical protein Bca52824_017638 [Brassica carinata]|uniref:Uncharacterized protein n=1 Tax=Brassica carinata TaxID=52824 RepID=A0A8X7VNF5_BRACI|nr:hypothetical protein Bca52824_017638 [Brassica carinata]
MNTSEVEAAATGKGSSEEEDRKDLEGNVTLFSILSALENMSRKFVTLTRGLTLTIKELDKDTGVKRTLAEEFGSGAGTHAKAPELDFVYVSPGKATKATKDDKDAQDAKGEAYARGCRGKRIVKDDDSPRANVIRVPVNDKEDRAATVSEDDSYVEHVVPGYSTRLKNNVNAILSSANDENLPVLYPGPGDLIDTTTPTWFRFLYDLSLVIPSILAEGWVHDWPTYRVIPDHFKEHLFLQLARKNTWNRRHNSTIWTHFNLVARSLFRFQMLELKRRWAHGGDKPSWMLTRIWRDLVDMFEEFGPDNFGFKQ